MDKKALKRVGKCLVNVLLYFFLAVCVFTVILTVLSNKDSDGAAEIFGYQMRVVTSDSMAKCELTDVSGYDIKSIPIRSMIFIELVPEDAAAAEQWYADIRKGDVLTFKYVYTSQVTITHRVDDIYKNPSGNGYTIVLSGDNKNADSSQLYQTIDTSVPEGSNYVIGKVTAKSFLLGFIISLLKTNVGIIFLVIIPCCIIILLEVLKIMSAYSAERKQREREEARKKDDELEELRRRLAALEAMSDKDGSTEEKDDR